MRDALAAFSEVWLVDFEFYQPTGERPRVLCMVAREWRTGRTIREWVDGLGDRPPIRIDPQALFVAYFTSAEMECFLSLGWERPARILDLFTEFRCLTNGRLPKGGHNSLLGALTYYGLDAMAGAEKDAMRQLAMRGGHYSEIERSALVDYCEEDVLALNRLLPAMLPYIDLPRALLRGRYMMAAAEMQWCGVPIDTERLAAYREHWDSIKRHLTQEVDRDFGVYQAASLPHINPFSPQGQLVIQVAAENEVDPRQLLAVADDVVKSYGDDDRTRAIAAARKATGLTLKKLADWEDSGRDYSCWPRLDETARELAGEYPELGIGPGYSVELIDQTDHAANLWELLRDPPDQKPKKFDEDTLREAASYLQEGEYDPGGRLSFNARRFGQWLVEHDIPWPRTPNGTLSLSDQSFRDMAKAYPEVSPLRELRHTLSELRLENLAVGSDGRNRCLLSPFGASSGRNTPSNTKSIFGPSCWLRGLIRPGPHRALAYVDWAQQEFAIAAVLSGDGRMREAYASGDPYLAFAKQAGAVPETATKQSHPNEREMYKTCALGVQYGMSYQSLAERLGKPHYFGKLLLEKHKETYARYWEWSQSAVNHAMLLGYLYTTFGWRIHAGRDAIQGERPDETRRRRNRHARSLANFPVQANGAEMLRIACILATDRGIPICMPVHDALLVEGPKAEIDDIVAATQEAMCDAGRIVLNGFEVRTDVELVKWPDRYADKRGAKMWEIVNRIVRTIESEEAASEEKF